MKRVFAILPLILFVALVVASGYSIWLGMRPTQAAVPSTTTPTTTPSPSPTAPSSPTTTPPPRTPTATLTPAPITATPPPSATMVITTTAEPPLLVWVSTDNSPVDPAHTLGISGPNLENPVLQAYAGAPALSPDGTKLAFFAESNLSGFNTGIWIADVSTGIAENHQLLVDITDVKSMAWSPDGDKIAFEVVVNPFEPPEAWRSQVQIVRANPEDGYVKQGEFDGRQPAWSPDSQSIVAQSCKGSECGLFIVNCAGDNCDYESAEQITTDVSDSFPTWSVQGDIAFTSQRDGNHEIYLRRTDGSLQNLSQRPSTDITPVFGPDGQRIYFRTDATEGGWAIQVITLDGTRQNSMSIDTLRPNIGGDDQDWGLVRPTVS